MSASGEAAATTTSQPAVRDDAMRRELVATRNLAAELRRRVAAQEVELEWMRAELFGTLPRAGLPSDMDSLLCLRHAIRDFAGTIVRPRVLVGLARRVIVGRAEDARQRFEQMLRENGVPAELAPAAGWIIAPRALLGLTLRRVICGRDSVEGLIVLGLERAVAARQEQMIEWRKAEAVGSHTLVSRRAIRDFAHTITRWRMIAGLVRRVMLGRRATVRRVVEALLREHGVPADAVPAAMWVAEPRVILGLACRGILAGRQAVEGLLVLELERRFNVEV